MRLGDFVKTFRSVVKTGSTTVANLFVEFFGGMFLGAASGGILVPLVQAATVAIDASLGNEFVLPLTTNVAFILGNPTNAPPTGFDQIIRITVKNTSGGAHGNGTFGTLYKVSATPMAAIADTKNRTLAFRWDGTNWVEIFLTAADVAN